MGSRIPKVHPGQPVRIGARAYNAIVEAANASAAQRQTGEPPRRVIYPNDHILVRNDSGTDQSRFAVLGIDDAIFDPASAIDSFKATIALACITPDVDDHKGRFVVLIEPIPDGEFGRAAVGGVVPVLIDVPDDGGSYAQPLTADVDDGNSENLLAASEGSAMILWRETGFGTKWGVVRIGGLSGLGNVFAVELTQTGGSNGTATTQASWTYTVKDLDGNTLLTAANPIGAPHKWRRPSLGAITAATFGYAHYSVANALTLGWINEVPTVEACEEA